MSDKITRFLFIFEKFKSGRIISNFLLLASIILANNITHAQTINAGTDTSFCSGNSIKLGGNPVATGSPISFSWTSSASATVFSTDSTPTVSPTSSTDYYLTVTYSSGTFIDTVTISVKNLPSITHLDSSAASAGSRPYTNCVIGGPYTLTLMNYSSTTSSNSSYSIDWGDGSSTNLTPSNFAYQGTTSHTYTTQGYYYINYKVTGTNGCKDSIRDTVFHGSNPIIGITNPGNTTDCSPYTLPFQINYRDTSFNPNVPGTKYRITSNYPGFVDSVYYHPITGMPDSIFTFTFIKTSCGYQANTIPNGFYVEVVSTNRCASAYSAAYPIHINDGANAYFTNTPDPKICQGNIMSFNGSDSTGTSINPSSPGRGCDQSLKKYWKIEPMTGVNVTSGKLGLNGVGPLFYGTKNIQVRFDSVGTFTIKYFLSNYCGVDSFEKTICVVPIPKSSFELSNSFLCNSDSIRITSAYTASNFCDSSSFRWSIKGIDNNCSPSSPNWVFVDSTNARSKNPSLKFLSSGLYQITLHDSSYCGVDSFSLVDIVASKPEIYFNVKPDSFCVNSPFTVDSLFVSDCYDSTTTYSWTFTGGVIQNPSSFNPGNFRSDSVGTYIISLTVTNRCSDSTFIDTITIVNNPVPTANFSMSDTTGCGDTQISLRDASIPSGLSSRWDFGDGDTSILTNPTRVFGNSSNTQDSTYDIRLIVTAGSGCSDTITKQLTINPLPKAGFSTSSQSVCAPAILNTNNTSVYKGSSFTSSWSASPSSVVISTSSSSSPSLSFPDNDSEVDTTYTIKLVVTSVDGCKDSITDSVVVYSRPNTSFSIDTGSCGSGGLLTDNHTDTSSLYGHSYKWEVNPSTGVSLNDILYEPTVSMPLNTTQASINYRFILTSTSKEGCIDRDTQQTVVYPKPLAKYRYSLPDSCSPDTASFTNLSDPYNSESISTMSFIWNFGSVERDPKKLFTNTGTVDSLYEVELISTSQHGCKDTFVDTVVIHPDARSDFNPTSTTGCAPLVMDSSLINLAQYASANDVYSWTIFGSDSSTILSSFQGVSFKSYTMSKDNDTTYVRLITSSNYGCKDDTLVIRFTTIKDPIANFTMSDTTGCGDTQISLQNASTPSGLTSRWDFGDGNTSVQTNPTHVFGNSSNIQDSTYNIRLIVKVGSGCSDTIVKSFTSFGKPFANFGANEACEYKSTIFTDSSLTGGSPLTDWNWDFGDTFGDTIQNPTHTYNQDGTYNVKLTVINSNGCIDSITKPVLSYPIPLLNFSYDTIVCEKDSVFMNNTTTGAMQYDWDFGNGNSDSRKSPHAYYDTSGLYPIRLIATSDFGCYDSLSKSIQVIGAPQASFIPSVDDGCAPLTVNFSNNSTAEYSEYKWDYGQGDVSVGPIADTIVYQQGRYDTTYYVRLVISNQCKTDTFIDSILVRPTPVAIFETDRDIGCSPLNLQFSNNLTYGNPDTLIWDFGDGSPIYKTTKNTDDEPLSHSFTTGIIPSDYTITYIAKNSCGADTAEKLVVVYKTVEALFDADTLSGCIPLTINFTNTSRGHIDYEWDFGDGNTSNLDNPSHTFTQVGTFTVRLFVSDSCSYDTFEQQVFVYPEPIVSFDFIKDSICQFDSIRFISTSNNVSRVYWDFGDGDSSRLNNVFHQFDSSGTFNVRYTGYSALHNCPATIAKDVHILPRPIAGFVPSVDSLCEYPADVDYTNTSIGAQEYNWIFGDGSRSTQTNPSLVLTSSGTYYDTLIASNQFGCSDTAISLIKVFDPPVADAKISPLNGCVPLEVDFENLSTNYLYSKWDFGNGDTSNQSDLTYTYDIVGSYLPSLIVYGNANCSDTFKLSSTIDVHPNPIADFDYSIESVKTLFDNKSTGANSYLWDFGDGGSSIEENPIYQFTESGIFSTLLVATNNFGCKDSIIKAIDISQSYGLFVSNAFSPEFGEPEVRMFKPRGIGLAEYQIYIYDTWGNLLWESNKLFKTEPSEGWDGKDKEGNDMPQDTYVWKVTAKFLNGRIWPGKVYSDGSVKRYGTVTLIR